MRFVIMLLLLCSATAARADVSVRSARLAATGFADGRGDIATLAISPSRGWLAVIDEHDSCCVASTLVLHVLTLRKKTIAEIPFACDGEDCQEEMDRPRAIRFLQRYGFIVPADALEIPSYGYGYGEEPRPVRAGELTFTRGYDELIVEARDKEVKRIDGRLSWAVYLPSKKLLVYRWFNSNIPESDDAYHPPYWGIELVPLR